MLKSWDIGVHTERNILEVTECSYQHSGQFWPDLHNLTNMLSAVQHPCFVSKNRNVSHFIANSHRFDEFSFAILCRTLKNAPVKQLAFNNCSLNASQVNLIGEMTGLKHFQSLQIDWNESGEGIIYRQFVEPESQLQKLSLKSCSLGNQGFFYICEALKNNQNLRILDLYGNRISDLVKLAECLESNRSLITLSLCGNEIKDENLAPLVGIFGKISYPTEGVEEYKNELKEQAKLKMQIYEKNNILGNVTQDELLLDEKSGEYFVHKNQTFLHLNLGLNKITSDHHLRLILSLAFKDFKVILSGNPFPTTIQNSLAEAFHENIIF